MYRCFRSHRNGKLIGHAILVPEPAFPMSDAAAAATENPNHPPEVRLPFVAPPSFLPSSVQSPAGPLSPSALSPSSYSPTGPSSIFCQIVDLFPRCKLQEK
ncbi:unnamed protein product [Musa banksii]